MSTTTRFSKPLDTEVADLDSKLSSYFKYVDYTSVDANYFTTAKGSSHDVTFTTAGIYFIQIQSNDAGSSGQDVTVKVGTHKILVMNTNGIQYQKASCIIPIKAGTTITTTAPSGTAIQTSWNRLS